MRQASWHPNRVCDKSFCESLDSLPHAYAGNPFEGGSVVIMLPLGCLKAGDIALWPALLERSQFLDVCACRHDI